MNIRALKQDVVLSGYHVPAGVSLNIKLKIMLSLAVKRLKLLHACSVRLLQFAASSPLVVMSVYLL